MNFTLHFGRLLFAALLPLVSLQAVELRFLNWEGQEDALKFTSDGTTVAISADENALSPSYHFEETGPLVLFKEVPDEGRTRRVTVATLAVPRGLTHAVVLLTAGDKTLTTYSGLWIDDSPTARPVGTVLLLNRSQHPLAFKMDETEFTLAPKAMHQLPVSADVKRIVVKADAEVAGRWEPVIGNPLPVRPGVRVLLLLRDGRPQPGIKTNLVDMLSFYDFPPAQPVTPAASLQ